MKFLKKKQGKFLIKLFIILADFFGQKNGLKILSKQKSARILNNFYQKFSLSL